MTAPSSAPTYPELAAELARTGRSYADVARAAGCAAGTLTHVVRGRLRPSADLRHRIAAAVDRDEAELFALAPDVQRLIDMAAEQGFSERVTASTTLAQVAALVRKARDVSAA